MFIRKKIGIIFGLCLCALSIQAQSYFQKIYKLGDSTSVFHDLYLKDTSIYVGGMVGFGGKEFYAHLTRLDQKGNVLKSTKNDISPFYQFAGFSKTDMDTNFRGNLVYGYVHMDKPGQTIGQPRITEFDLEGNVIADIPIDDFRSDTLFFFTNGTLINSLEDSSYYLCFAYTDEKIGDQIDDVGSLLFKVKYSGEVLWSKKFRFAPGTSRPHWIRGDYKRLNDSLQSLFIYETMSYSPFDGEKDWSRARFITIDKQGEVIESKIFQDTQDDGAGLSFLTLEDHELIYAYYDSELKGTPPSSDKFYHRSVISRLDTNMNIVWKDTLLDLFGNWSSYSTPNRIRKSTDSTILYAFNYVYAPSGSILYKSLRIENRKLSGELLWHRDYIYWPDNVENQPTVQILDIDSTSQGDWLFAGQFISNELIGQGLSGQNAYLLKTNCLGFMGDPIASLDIYDLGNNQVKLVNKSLQAGSFEWDLGDGTSLSTRESVNKAQDTIYHTYPDHGAYIVKLIAKGCPGKAGTIEVPWNWVKLDELEKRNKNFLQIAPNPISSGELLNVYVGRPEGKTFKLQIFDQKGRILKTISVLETESYIATILDLPKGLYNVRLSNESKVLDSELIIVK